MDEEEEAPSGVAWVVPAGLPTKSIDISECFVLWSLRGIAFPFVVYCLFFLWGHPVLSRLT